MGQETEKLLLQQAVKHRVSQYVGFEWRGLMVKAMCCASCQPV